MNYEEWFAREYMDRESLSADIRAMRDKLLGRTLDSVMENRDRVMACFTFGSIMLYIWYPDATRVKTGLNGRDLWKEELKDAPYEKGELNGRRLAAMFVAPDVYMSPGAIALYLESDNDVVSVMMVPGKGLKTVGGVSIGSKYAVLSEERIPMIEDRFRRRLFNIDTGETRTEIANRAGTVMIRADYNDIELGDAVRGIYRTVHDRKTSTGDILTLYGACDDSGCEVIPCRYDDLYCMANGFFLVMDKDRHWWVLDGEDTAVYGPSVYGADIYGESREYLFVVEYNEGAGFECLGIYDVGMSTVTCGAVFSRIKYIGDGRFAVTRVMDNGIRLREVVDKFGNILT